MISHRSATLDDVPALVDLVDSAYRGARSRAGWTTEEHLLGGQRVDVDMLAETIADPSQCILLLDTAGGLTGCVVVEKRPGYGYIGMVSVRPAAQGNGTGRQLLEIAENHVRQIWAMRCARMTVLAQRPELISWYERRGYCRTGDTAPFPYTDQRFGLPKRDDLYFVVLEKRLT